MILPATPHDPWTVLRRSYTGPMFAIHLVMLVAFVLPLGARLSRVKRIHATQEVTTACESSSQAVD